MKRIALLLAICLMIINLSACSTGQEQITPVTSFPQANFNNNFWFSGNFWAFEDNIFYLQDGFYNMGAYWSTNGTSEKLFEESDFSKELGEPAMIGDIFVCDGYLYFELFSDKEDMLYRYDLKERAYAPVCETPSLYRWVVVDDYFIYREHPSNNDEKRTPLCVYNLTDGTTTQVCPDVEEFGIVDGQLRFITNTDTYELYQYNYADNHSTVLGTFACEFDDAYDIFNFTADGVVMLNWSKDYERNLVVYSLSSNSAAVYTLPKGIQHMVAYDQYAYAVVYDTQKNTSEAVAAEENGIYRIRLADGSYEVIESNANDDTEIHVVSDDCIYIIQGKLDILYRYRRHVYKFDYRTGNEKKLAVI